MKPESDVNFLVLTTVKPVHTGMPCGQSFIPVWTGSGLDRVFVFGEEQTTITCTIDTRVKIQGASSVGLQMIGECMQINLYNKGHHFLKMFYFIKIMSIYDILIYLPVLRFY